MPFEMVLNCIVEERVDTYYTLLCCLTAIHS